MKDMEEDRGIILSAIVNLHKYCLGAGFKGYSLYDSHNSPIPFARLGSKLSFFINQITKRSPINLRPILGIRKARNPKGMGLFLNGYLNLKEISVENIEYDELIQMFFNWLATNYSYDYHGYSWGYNFDWPSIDGSFVPAYTPSSVVTAVNIRAIFHYFTLTNDPKATKIVNGAKEFILNEIPVIDSDDGLCYSYTPLWKDITINANLFAAEILAYSDYINRSEDNLPKIEGVLYFTMNRQNNDGSWYYSYDVKTGKPKKQIDFHQGYVIDSICNICRYSSLRLNDFLPEIHKGLDFYLRNQFDSSGRAFWRYPKKWPIDIHNQSQGIITFSNFCNEDDKYLLEAMKIAKWTINNMQGKDGHFFYQKWPILTNRLDYMRWNQSWMLLALSTLVRNFMTLS